METRAETTFATGSVPGPLLEELAAARGKLAPRATLTMLELTAERGEMPPLHVHDEPEAFRVLEGTLLVFAGGACIRLEAGRSTVVPAGVPHAHRAASARVSYLVASFVRSPGAYERFLQAVARPSGSTSEPEDGDRVVEALAGENGIAVLGPPGALPSVDLAA